VRVALLVAAPSVPVIVTGVLCPETGVVVIGKVADVAPWATVTDAGTVAAALLELSVIVVPPTGAPEARVTFPVEVPPPIRPLGESETVND
jgi:hypothetical protein